MEIDQTIKRAGLIVEEFAKLAGVTRVAVYLWIKGNKINAIRVPRVEKLLAAIDAAVEAGELPMDGVSPRTKHGKEFRMLQLKKIVIKHLQVTQKTV